MDPGTPKKRDGRPARDHADDEATQLTTPAPVPEAGDATRQTNIDAFDLASGAMLGEYRIEQKIGEGGMGVVFSAVHPLIGKRAAIKVLKRELCQDPYTVERFQDEARVVNEIGHPNIVDVFAFGEMPGGRRYFVMEWLKGESLRERIARVRTPLPAICAILRPLARALEAAHEKGIIHRDLKPDNVFLVETREGEPTVKLLDFGIAKLAHTNEPRLERTATGTMVGTPMYIAPEQARGHAIDHRVDIYSLGAIAFELLTGRTPFLADNAMEMVAKHLMEEPPTVASVWPQVPPALDRMVTGMLAKDATQRPSLAALCAILDEVKTWDLALPAQRASHGNLSVATSTVTGAVAPAASPMPRRLLIAAAVIIVAVISFVIASRSGPSVPAVARATVPPATVDAAVVVAASVDASVADPVVPIDAEAVVASPPDAAVHVPVPVPAPPHIARPTKGVLTIRLSNAQSATITVDGTYMGDVNNGAGEVAMTLEKPHHLELHAPDGASLSFGLTLFQSRTAKTFALVPLPKPVIKPVPKPALNCHPKDDGILPPGCLQGVP